MTLTDHDLSALLAAVQSGEMTETVRTSLAWVLQELIEAELTATIGAAPGQRAEGRTAQRNGHRPKLITTAAGDVKIGIPKLRTGSFFPSILERRRRIDRALEHRDAINAFLKQDLAEHDTLAHAVERLVALVPEGA